MRNILLYLAVFASIGSVNASWYWPFDAEDDDAPRLSELMSDSTALIDEATELAADGKTQEAVAKYREALTELARVEADNPERAATTEFSSLRNKRAYVSAAIDSLLLAEARANAKAVAVTDTTELEKKYLQKHGKMPLDGASAKPAPAAKVSGSVVAKAGTSVRSAKRAAKKVSKNPVKKTPVESLVAKLEKEPGNRKCRLALAGEFIKTERYDDAKREIGVLLKENMTDSSALNLKAVCEASRGDFKSAEATLDLAIQSHPRDYNGYYNMANLKLQGAANKDLARRYYETGRALGGPKDESLEAAME